MALTFVISPEDNADMWRGWGMSSAQALAESYTKSVECFSIVCDDKVLGMMGVTKDGIVWLMRAHNFDKISFRVARHGHEYIQRWLLRFGHLEGFLHESHEKFTRWLEYEGGRVLNLANGYCKVTFDIKDFIEPEQAEVI